MQENHTGFSMPLIPKRRAVLLCGGGKDGSKDKQFYKQMIPPAEAEFADHLKSEGLK